MHRSRGRAGPAGRSEEAITASQRAQNLLREIRGQREEAKALSSQGAALAKVRRVEDAITVHHQGRDIFHLHSSHVTA
jgi:Flp pilus assembly protein TadD